MPIENRLRCFGYAWCLKGLNAKRYNNRVVEGTARNLRLSRLLCLSAFYAILDFFLIFLNLPICSEISDSPYPLHPLHPLYIL